VILKMNSIEEGLFKNDKEGQQLNQNYRNFCCSNNPDLRKCAIIFNQIICHLQQKTIYSISQIINRFIIENADLDNSKRYILVTFLDLDSYIRFKRRL
jgi:hypothetical protein